MRGRFPLLPFLPPLSLCAPDLCTQGNKAWNTIPYSAYTDLPCIGSTKNSVFRWMLQHSEIESQLKKFLGTIYSSTAMFLSRSGIGPYQKKFKGLNIFATAKSTVLLLQSETGEKYGEYTWPVTPYLMDSFPVVCMYVCTCMYVCMYACMYVCMYYVP